MNFVWPLFTAREAHVKKHIHTLWSWHNGKHKAKIFLINPSNTGRLSLTHRHIKAGTVLSDTYNHSDIFCTPFSHYHAPAYSPTLMKLCLQVHTQTHSRTYVHSCFHMHMEAAANTDSDPQTQMFLHLLQPVLCPPHTLIHITCCSYAIVLLTTLLHYREGCEHFLDRFCSCVAKHPTSRIQGDWSDKSYNVCLIAARKRVYYRFIYPKNKEVLSSIKWTNFKFPELKISPWNCFPYLYD